MLHQTPLPESCSLVLEALGVSMIILYNTHLYLFLYIEIEQNSSRIFVVI